MAADHNLYMTACNDGTNQKFYWDGEFLKVEANNYCVDLNHLGNLYVHACHGGPNQKFYWDELHYKGRTLQSGNSCLDINGPKEAVMFSCHNGSNQLFYFEGESLRVEAHTGLCLNYGTDKLYLESCQDKNTQKFFLENQNMRTRQDGTCLDVQPFNGKTWSQTFMGSCPSSTTLKWTFKSQLHNSAQLTVATPSLYCLTLEPSSNPPLAAKPCAAVEAKSLWYFTGDLLKSEHDASKCLYYNYFTKKIQYGSCTHWPKMKFHDEGGVLRNIGYDGDLCLNYDEVTNTDFLGFCPDARNHQWRFGYDLARKVPLPTAFQHGQSLHASCWSERFAAGSRTSETMSCVAGAWINSQNKAGLDGFTCASCIQVVSKVYADLDSIMRQELFFVSRMKLELAVDTRTRRSVTSSGALRLGGSADLFVAELMPGAADTMHRFRSLTTEGQCLKAAALRLTASACNDTDPGQLMEAVELGTLMWDEFQAGTAVPTKSQSGLLNRGSAPTTLRSFQLDASCGQHVLSSIGFSYNGLLGMSATCTAASTYGDAVEHTLSVPGDIKITSVSDGTCMSIHRIVPFRLRVQLGETWWCLRYDSESNVDTASCSDDNGQKWYMINGNIISLKNGLCLDVNTGTSNVYMHGCHNGDNQKFYWDEDDKDLRSEWNHKCLDRNHENNIYMHPCTGGENQKFDFDKVDGSAFTTALHLECSESEKEAITVEPVGTLAKFHLKHGQVQFPGEYKWNANAKSIQKIGTTKCLEARGLGRVEERDCAERVEQEWTLSHGLFGLTDSPLKCPTDQIISYVEKTSSQIKFNCSHVSSLGACTLLYSTQVETKSSDLEKIKALPALGAFCPPGEGLKSFETEASDKGAWIRVKFTCCQISRVPASIYPTLNGGRREFETSLAEAWEGIYCPESRDDSGRMAFKQSRSFRPGQGASGTLSYDKLEGKWCVPGKDCAYSDVVHPLDTSLHTDAWYVVPVSDFDAAFEAKGVKQVTEKRRKPPQLIKFGASAPEYLPECKDESHPGARSFKLADMNAEARVKSNLAWAARKVGL